MKCGDKVRTDFNDWPSERRAIRTVTEIVPNQYSQTKIFVRTVCPLGKELFIDSAWYTPVAPLTTHKSNNLSEFF